MAVDAPGENTPEPTPPAEPVDAASTATTLPDEVREPLAKAAGSERMLWIGLAGALLIHTLPFLYLGEPDPLGEGVLTEAIAVELIDAATLAGKDQTPPSAPAQAAPAPPPVPSGPPQKAQAAVPPSPPPSRPETAAPKPDLAPQPPESAALPGFAGDGETPPKAKPERAEPTAKQPDETRPEPQKKASEDKPAQPRRPPPRPATQQQAPTPPPAANTSPPRAASAPAQARSGKVSQFSKEVVAALAKAKPSARGIKGNVTVTVVVAFGGGVRVAKVTGSSGREDLDRLALEAARNAKLPAPPADVSTDDLFYDVEYKFE